MKKIALAAAAASLMFASAASAADLAPRYTKAPPPVIAPIYNWTGFYIGINGGWASSHKCWDFAGTVAVPLAVLNPEGCHDATGGTVGTGVEIGFAPNWSVAFEYDHIFLGDRNITFTSPTFTVDRIRQDVDMVTARVNYRFGGPVVAKY